jgi:hypothetical protein
MVEKSSITTKKQIKNHNSSARSINGKHTLQVDCVSENLLCFIFEVREQGWSVSICMVTIMKARELDSSF